MTISPSAMAVKRFIDKGGTLEEASKHFKLKVSSVERYLRTAKHKVKDPPKIPRVLIFDIETAPMSYFGWELKIQGGYIPHTKIISEWFMLSWSAKWLNTSEIMGGVLTPKEVAPWMDKKVRIGNDRRIAKGIWSLVNKADIIIAHNAQKFDVRKINARFLAHDFPPPMHYRVIDTLKESRKIAAFSSHKMDFLAKQVGLRQKDDVDWELWEDCMYCDPDALKRMQKYNQSDVLALEDLYYYLRPWIKSHPNLALYVETERNMCPTCLNTDLVWPKDAYYYTNFNRFKAFRCKRCFSIGRKRLSDLTTDERSCLVVPVPR